MSREPTTRSRWLLLLPVLLGTGTPLTVSQGRLAVATAECQGPSCCPETRSICVIGESMIGNKYYIPSGSCTDPKQPLPPP
jgi:hypothetical protein